MTDTIWLPDFAQSNGPKYRTLENSIRQAIRSGDLGEGERLPPVRELGWQAGITPGTVARAYKNLVDAGVLESTVGRGTFVPVQRKPRVAPLEHDPAATLISPRLPDVGQSDLLREAYADYAKNVERDRLLCYPVRPTQTEAIRAFVDLHRDDPIGELHEDDVVITHGGQNAISLVLMTVLRGPSPTVLVDALSYGGFRRAAEVLRARVLGVDWDDEGPIPEEFERLCRDEGVQIFLTSSEVNNPMNRTTSIRRRHEIAEIAERHGVHILDDDCYRNGPFIGPSYRQIIPELAWYTTSPCKSFSAALRVGFVAAPTGWANRLIRAASAASYGVPDAVTAAYAYVARHPKTPQILEAARQHLAYMVETAVNCLGAHRISWRKDVPLIWLELPEGWRMGEFCRIAEREGVFVRTAEDFSLRDGRQVQGVRIALNGEMSTQRLESAMMTLNGLLARPPERISV